MKTKRLIVLSLMTILFSSAVSFNDSISSEVNVSNINSNNTTIIELNGIRDDKLSERTITLINSSDEKRVGIIESVHIDSEYDNIRMKIVSGTKTLYKGFASNISNLRIPVTENKDLNIEFYKESSTKDIEEAITLSINWNTDTFKDGFDTEDAKSLVSTNAVLFLLGISVLGVNSIFNRKDKSEVL